MWGENGRLQFHCTSTDVHRSQPASGWDSRLAVLSCHRSSVACCRRLRPFRSRQTTVDLASHIPAAIVPASKRLSCPAIPAQASLAGAAPAPAPAPASAVAAPPPPLRLWEVTALEQAANPEGVHRMGGNYCGQEQGARGNLHGRRRWPASRAHGTRRPRRDRKPAPTACAAPPPAGRGFTAHWTDRRHVRACCAARPALPSTAAGASRHASPALCTSRSRPRLHPPAPVAGASSLSLRRGSSW